MSNYESYLPHINAEEGIKRVMNNKKLYYNMLTRFNLREMADKLTQAVKESENEAIGFSAHALKGTLGNLGFPTLFALTGDIEAHAKKNEPVDHLMGGFNSLVSEVIVVIERFLENEK
ncbi:MAG: Hpt domain-containing protein [Defluviitaleaceae bacterium]|nr:Hpt domain-containing protein [Defluviitaleaceae bacterium]MCL2273293.1 Hpt domain-containing protein [Defluviitaleaceae bacterium]